jgi:hypothetical protein
MTTYIGTATSRVDGRAKVTGTAKNTLVSSISLALLMPASLLPQLPKAASRVLK